MSDASPRGGARWFSGSFAVAHGATTSIDKTKATGGGSAGVTRYGSFTDLINGTNGTYFHYGNGSNARHGYNDRFFAFEGKFDRTNTGSPVGGVSSFAIYNSFNDLVSGTT